MDKPTIPPCNAFQHKGQHENKHLRAFLEASPHLFPLSEVARLKLSKPLQVDPVILELLIRFFCGEGGPYGN